MNFQRIYIQCGVSSEMACQDSSLILLLITEARKHAIQLLEISCQVAGVFHNVS